MIKKIAVISKNLISARLIELEAESIGISAESFDELPSDLSLYSMLFIDVDTVKLKTSQFACLTAAYGEKMPNANAFWQFIEYPFALSKLRSVLFSGLGDLDSALGEDLVIYANEERRTVEIFGKSVSLSEYEFKVLSRLCETPNKPVSRKELSELLGADFDGNMADVYICYLRRKFDALTQQKVIRTVRSVGYVTDFELCRKM